MNRRLSSSTRSQTEDSIFLKPDEDPMWLDDLPTTDNNFSQPGDGSPSPDANPGRGNSPPKDPEKLWRDTFYIVVMGMHWCAVLCTISQITVGQH